MDHLTSQIQLAKIYSSGYEIFLSCCITTAVGLKIIWLSSLPLNSQLFQCWGHFLSKHKNEKIFEKPSKPCHVGIHLIAFAEYSQMSTCVPGFQSFFRFLHLFVLVKLVTMSIRVKVGSKMLSCNGIGEIRIDTSCSPLAYWQWFHICF